MLYERYNINNDTFWNVRGTYWYGQTFTIGNSGNNHNFTLTSLKLKCYKAGTIGDVVVSIRATSGGVPINPNLSTTTFDGDSLTTDTGGEWKEVVMPSVVLNKYTMYSIVVSCNGANGTTNKLALLGDFSSPTYGGGTGASNEGYGVDGGWVIQSAVDVMFEIYGDEVVYGIRTKLTIDGTEYGDYLTANIRKTIGDSNQSSTIELLFDSPYGRYKSNFNIGDEIIFYADYDTLPVTKLFSGIIENLSLDGSENYQKLRISGRDYSLRLRDLTVEPKVFLNTEISDIVTQLITDNNVPDITVNNVDETEVTLSKIRFNHLSIADALDQLSELSGFIWYVDSEKDLHFEQRKTISSGYTLDNSNIYSSNFDKSRMGMANRIWVYGDRQLSGYMETYKFGSPLNGSIVTLLSKPHNTKVTRLGSILIGGIFETTIGELSGPNYLVDFDNRQLIFQSGTTIGYDSIPGSGGSVVIDYQRELPIVKFGQNDTSINLYGPKNLIIQDKNIKDPNLALEIVRSKVNDSDPLNRISCDLIGWFDFVPGETVNFILNDFNINQSDISIIDINYKFDKTKVLSEKVISVTLSKKFIDITDQLKSLDKRLRQIESESLSDSDVITRLLSSQENMIVVGSKWNVLASTTTGSTYYIYSTGFTPPINPFKCGSGTNQGYCAGSFTGSGLAFTTFSIRYTGSNNYESTGSYNPNGQEGGGYGIFG